MREARRPDPKKSNDPTAGATRPLISEGESAGRFLLVTLVYIVDERHRRGGRTQFQLDRKRISPKA